MSGGGGDILGDVLGVAAPFALNAIAPGIGGAIGGAIGDAGVGASTAADISSGLIGAATSGGIAALTGKNPLQAALIGGIGAGLGNEFFGDTPAGAAQGAEGTGASPQAANALSSASGDTGGNLTNTSTLSGGDTAPVISSGDTGSNLTNTNTMGSGAPGGNTSVNISSNSPSDSSSSGIGKWLSKQNPLTLALGGNAILSSLQSLMSPPQKYSVGNTANSVLNATNPGFSNASLPSYTMQNTATPYSGNWYNYGSAPRSAMYNAMPVAAAHGGLMKGYAHGGKVQRFAVGGMPMPGAPAPNMGAMPPAPPAGGPPQMPARNPLQAGGPAPMPPQGRPMALPSQPQQGQPNPRDLIAAHQIGVAIGRHLKSKMTTPDGKVKGPGGGQDDAIPARLSQDEYIVPADIVAHLGDGSSNAGGKVLDNMVHNVRQQKATSGKFPPKAKNPLAYMAHVAGNKKKVNVKHHYATGGVVDENGNSVDLGGATDARGNPVNQSEYNYMMNSSEPFGSWQGLDMPDSSATGTAGTANSASTTPSLKAPVPSMSSTAPVVNYNNIAGATGPTGANGAPTNMPAPNFPSPLTNLLQNFQSNIRPNSSPAMGTGNGNIGNSNTGMSFAQAYAPILRGLLNNQGTRT